LLVLEGRIFKQKTKDKNIFSGAQEKLILHPSCSLKVSLKDYKIDNQMTAHHANYL